MMYARALQLLGEGEYPYRTIKLDFWLTSVDQKSMCLRSLFEQRIHFHALGLTDFRADFSFSVSANFTTIGEGQTSTVVLLSHGAYL